MIDFQKGVLDASSSISRDFFILTCKFIGWFLKSFTTLNQDSVVRESVPELAFEISNEMGATCMVLTNGCMYDSFIPQVTIPI